MIGLIGALIIDRVQGRRTLSAERKRAFANFVGALYSAVGEFRDMPPNRQGGLLEKMTSAFRTEQAEWVEGRQAIAKAAPSAVYPDRSPLGGLSPSPSARPSSHSDGIG